MIVCTVCTVISLNCEHSLSLQVRSANIFHEGLRGTVKESAIIGYGRHGEFLTISFSFLDNILQGKSRWHCL